MYFRLELPATTWHATQMVTVTQSLERNKDWLIAKILLLARFVKHKTDLAGPDWFCIWSDLCGFDQNLDALSSKVGILHRFKLSHVCPQCARALARPIKRMIVHFLRIENIKLMYLVKYLLKQGLGKGEGWRLTYSLQGDMQFRQDWHAVRIRLACRLRTVGALQKVATLLPQRKEGWGWSTLVWKDK